MNATDYSLCSLAGCHARHTRTCTEQQKESIKRSLLIYNISFGWTCPVLVMLCLLHPPHTPPCIHSNTHTCTKYVSCSILATGKVITERAKELACCRAADLIPALEKKAEISTLLPNTTFPPLCCCNVRSVSMQQPAFVRISDTFFHSLCLQVGRLWTQMKT